MYFNHWITTYLEQPDRRDLRLTETHGRWIFALLSRVDEYLSADDQSLLRTLARSCMGLIRFHLSTKEDKEGNLGDEIQPESCWLIITAIIGVWAQHDLWSDAERMLAEQPKEIGV
jgi:hypothetical protein